MMTHIIPGHGIAVYIQDLMKCLLYHKQNSSVVGSLCKLIDLVIRQEAVADVIVGLEEKMEFLIDLLGCYQHQTQRDVVRYICNLLCTLMKHRNKGFRLIISEEDSDITSNIHLDKLLLELSEQYHNDAQTLAAITTLREASCGVQQETSSKHSLQQQESSITKSRRLTYDATVMKEELAVSAMPNIIASADVEVTAPIDIDLFKGTWKRTAVVLKLVPVATGNDVSDRRAKQAWLQEYETLSMLRHPRIVNLLGCCLDVSIALMDAVMDSATVTCRSAVVLEYMANGNLRSLLNAEYASLSAMEKVQIAVDVSEGMRFLHDCNLFHRDLRSVFVLLDGHTRAKLTGFGPGEAGWSDSNVSVDADRVQMSMKAKSKEDKQLRLHADITAFGVVLWELITGKTPWSNAGIAPNNGKASQSKHKQQKQAHHHKLKLTEEESKQCPVGFAATWTKCMASANFADKANSVIFHSFVEIHAALHTILEDEMKRMREREKLVPDGFLCPITQDVMKDPVMLLDGHSYERKSITDWLKRCKRSPLTNEELPVQSDGSGMPLMLDNYALKSSIESFSSLKPM
jgi:serine/threonine protein kinase